MDRLTVKNVNGKYVEKCHVDKYQLINRLAEYEDTGLDPFEIKRLHNISKGYIIFR